MSCLYRRRFLQVFEIFLWAWETYSDDLWEISTKYTGILIRFNSLFIYPKNASRSYRISKGSCVGNFEFRLRKIDPSCCRVRSRVTFAWYILRYVYTISFTVRLIAKVCRSELLELRAWNSKYNHELEIDNRVINGLKPSSTFSNWSQPSNCGVHVFWFQSCDLRNRTGFRTYFYSSQWFDLRIRTITTNIRNFIPTCFFWIKYFQNLFVHLIRLSKKSQNNFVYPTLLDILSFAPIFLKLILDAKRICLRKKDIRIKSCVRLLLNFCHW